MTERNGSSSLLTVKWSGSLSIAISMLALAISGLTAYHTIVLEKDDLSVVTGVLPVLHLSDDGQRVVLGAEQELQFINLGNRPAIVSEFVALVEGVGPSGKADCHDNRSLMGMLPYEMDPLVIKAGDLAAVVLGKQRGPIWIERDDGDFEMRPDWAEELGFKRGSLVAVCLHMTVTTPRASRDVVVQRGAYPLGSRAETLARFQQYWMRMPLVKDSWPF